MNTEKKNAKQQILKKARDFFIENGFHATKTREITEALGLSSGALYVHFKNKDELFEIVIKEYHPWLQIPKAVSSVEGNSIEEIISNALKKLESTWAENPDYVRLHLIEIVEFKGKHLPKLFEETFNSTKAIIQNYRKENNELKDINSKVLDRALLGLFFGYTFLDRSISGIPQNSDPFIHDYFADSYLHGILNFREEEGGEEE